MYLEHQSTSGTKISAHVTCTSEVLLNYYYTEITVAIVSIRLGIIILSSHAIIYFLFNIFNAWKNKQINESNLITNLFWFL